MDFIWKIAMESPDEEIANEAIQLIINYSYINLNPRLKKVGARAQNRRLYIFIDKFWPLVCLKIGFFILLLCS